MIIGITGYKQSGKSTIAEYLVDNYEFIHLNFADPIKAACKIIFRWTDEHVYGKLKETIDPQWGISPRQAMQALGTEFGQYDLCRISPEFARVTGRALWAQSVKYEIEKANEWTTRKNFVISDFRFPHEREILLEMRASLWKVVRDSVKPLDLIHIHESEVHVDTLGVNHVLYNNGSYDDLYNQIDFMVEQIKEENK